MLDIYDKRPGHKCGVQLEVRLQNPLSQDASQFLEDQSWNPGVTGCKESLLGGSAGPGPGRRQASLIHNTSTSCVLQSVLSLPPAPVRLSLPLQGLETSFGGDINTSKGFMSGKEVNSGLQDSRGKGSGLYFSVLLGELEALLPCTADIIFLVFSDTLYKPQSCQTKLSWKHMVSYASSSKNAVAL